MTQAKLRKNFYQLIVQKNTMIELIMLFETLIQSKAINIDNEPEESNRLPPIIYHAILCEMALRAKPKTESDLIESEFLQRFL